MKNSTKKIIILEKSVDKKRTNMYINHRQAAVAQSVEQRTENPCVNSSILFGGRTTLI